MFRLYFITANPSLAKYVLNRGVDRIFVDLEVIGKFERQGHLDTVISGHQMIDVSLLRPVAPNGTLLVRLNPLYSGTESEINLAVRQGADILMLPMFRSPDDVKQFCELVNARAKVCLLVETTGAMETLSDCIQIPGVNEVHIGLNDLHLEMGCRFMFEPLVSGHVEDMAEILRNAGMPFGIGGLARVGEGLVPAELLLAEHVRLGSTGAILSRTFHRQACSIEEIESQMDLGDEIRKLRRAYYQHCKRARVELEGKTAQLRSAVAQIAANRPVK